MDEIETYKWKTIRSLLGTQRRDEPQDANDHHMDGLNGLLASRPQPTTPQSRPVSSDDLFVNEPESLSSMGL